MTTISIPAIDTKSQQANSDQNRMAPLEMVLAAIAKRGDPVPEEPNSAGFYKTHCPGLAHKNGDEHPGLGFKVMVSDQDEQDTWIAVHCFAGCSRQEVLEGFGLSPKDVSSNHGNTSTSTFMHTKQLQPALTIAEISREKLLPPDYLFFRAMLEENAPTFHDKYGKPYKRKGVVIPYFHSDGTPTEHKKLRTALMKTPENKGNIFYWTEGDEEIGPYYRPDSITKAQEVGYIIVEEGESDWWTLDYHGFPAMGISGANNVKRSLKGSLLAGIPRVYVTQEKTDQAGINFPYAVQIQLHATGYTGEILRIPLRNLTKAKDPSDLHKQLWNAENPRDHEAFRTEFQKTLDQAKRMDQDTGDDPEAAADRNALELAIEEKDLETVLLHMPTLARMARAEYLLIETRIRATFKNLNKKEFTQALNDERRKIAAELAQANTANGLYGMSEEAMTYVYKNEQVDISNFTAQIVADILVDDGAERKRLYEIAAFLAGQEHTFQIPAKDFIKAEWIDEQLGAKATVTVGQSMKAHLINAIKSCSEPEVQRHYAHTGWCKIGGEMVYLHSGGALSQVSQVTLFKKNHLTQANPDVDMALQAHSEGTKNALSQVSQVSQVNNHAFVQLSNTLCNYQLPHESASIVTAIQASLKFLELTQDAITFPLYSSLWRALLPGIDYSVHLAGASGEGKTELVSLIQQHFGSNMDSTHLPGSWESTDNSLESLLFEAKDSVVVIDDFKAKGSKNEQDRLHSKADRLFRQRGNGSARGRLNGNLEQRVSRIPRCMIFSTGEDVPKGQSLRARLVVLFNRERLTTGDNARKLTQAQEDARHGLYAEAMAGYISWLAPQMEALQVQFPSLISNQRDQLRIEGHGRSGTKAANMLIGIKFFLRFACEMEAITQEQEQAYIARCLASIQESAEEALEENANDKPSEQWRRLLVAALTSKRAHLLTSNGGNPGEIYGWKKSIRTDYESDGTSRESITLSGGGTPIGWIDGEDIYLTPSAAYEVVCAMGNGMSDQVVTLEGTLRKFLAQDKLLASTGISSPRKTITVRRRLENLQRDVLHLKKNVLFPTDFTPPSKTVDSLDSLDSAPLEPASQADVSLSQVVDSLDSAPLVVDSLDSAPSPRQEVQVKNDQPICTDELEGAESISLFGKVCDLLERSKKAATDKSGQRIFHWDKKYGYTSGFISGEQFEARLWEMQNSGSAYTVSQAEKVMNEQIAVLS